ncbi:MAG: Holliday junction branch migration protein RuvA [bacterium]
MIASLRGVVAGVADSSVVVEVGGVGILAHCTPGTARGVRAGERITLYTSLVVREDSLTLYGFPDADQREVFEAVQTVSGVGPRIALAALSTLTPDDLRRAVSRGDAARLTAVPGIGRKGAERLILELRDRLAPAATGGTAGSGDAWREDVRSGLESLGWSAREADAALAAVEPLAREQAEPDVAALLKAALRTLDRG